MVAWIKRREVADWARKNFRWTGRVEDLKKTERSLHHDRRGVAHVESVLKEKRITEEQSSFVEITIARAQYHPVTALAEFSWKSHGGGAGEGTPYNL